MELRLGIRGEKGVTEVLFPLSTLIAQYGAGTAQLIHQRETDAAPYPCTVTQDDDMLHWPITLTETTLPGRGACELHFYVGNALKKTAKWRTLVEKSLDDPMGAPPSGYETIIEKMTELSEAATSAATVAGSARADALTAALAAHQAQTDAEVAQGEAANAQRLAEDAQVAAETAQRGAEDARAAAQTAQTAAETAQDAAEGAQTAAETAQTAAENAASDASNSANAAAQSATAAAYALSHANLVFTYLSPGAQPTASYDAETLTLTVGIPENLRYVTLDEYEAMREAGTLDPNAYYAIGGVDG